MRTADEHGRAHGGAAASTVGLDGLLRVFKPGTPGLGKRLGAIPRMVKASMRGEYDGGLRLALMAAAPLYIVSPIDAVPESVPPRLRPRRRRVRGDLARRALLAETERFLEWEKANGRGTVGDRRRTVVK